MNLGDKCSSEPRCATALQPGNRVRLCLKQTKPPSKQASKQTNQTRRRLGMHDPRLLWCQQRPSLLLPSWFAILIREHSSSGLQEGYWTMSVLISAGRGRRRAKDKALSLWEPLPFYLERDSSTRYFHIYFIVENHCMWPLLATKGA